MRITFDFFDCDQGAEKMVVEQGRDEEKEEDSMKGKNGDGDW